MLQLKGYKAASGNYITKAENIKRHRKFMREQKESRKNYYAKLEREESIAYAGILEEKKQAQKADEEQKQIIAIKDNIRLEVQKNNPFTFKQFLIFWDIFMNNYIQIENDLQKGKINKNDITIVFNYIEGYNKSIVNEYWENKLLAV